MIDKLEFLLALAREKHFARAAEACSVTQPTLSAGIKPLEDALGVLLVNRTSRFQDFTPEGERVLDWARRIVGDARAMRQEVHTLLHSLTGRLRIAAIPTTLAMIESLTTPYRERHPDVNSRFARCVYLASLMPLPVSARHCFMPRCAGRRRSSTKRPSARA